MYIMTIHIIVIVVFLCVYEISKLTECMWDIKIDGVHVQVMLNGGCDDGVFLYDDDHNAVAGRVPLDKGMQ